MLSSLVVTLQQSLSILHKQDIQTAAQILSTQHGFLSFDERQRAEGRGQEVEKFPFSCSPSLRVPASPCPPLSPSILLGDDCAAIPDGEGYLLMAAEGMLPAFVESDPWFAGWCAVMVNVSDIHAMGGRSIAVVDTLWSQSIAATQPIWQGMKAAADAYGVPIVGGHTNCHSPYNALSVAILGRANRLISGFAAKPGDRLLMVSDFRGQAHPTYPFWNAATTADPARLLADLELLPRLAELDLCDAGKDISMGGIIGTTLMLLETSGCGATLDLDAIPCPPGLSLEQWLVSFPSYGFLLSVCSDRVSAVQAHFRQRDLVCESVGEVQPTHKLILRSHHESIEFWDLSRQQLTGFSVHPQMTVAGMER